MDVVMITVLCIMVGGVAIAVASRTPLFYLPSFIAALYIAFTIETSEAFLKLAAGVFAACIAFAFAFELR